MENSIWEWMRSRHNIPVKLDWTKACVDWLLQEENGMIDTGKAESIVYEQWLHSNIRDTCNRCLPNDILQRPNGTLEGQYIVQIDSFVNVGQPAYSQLMKIKGKEIDETTTETKNNFEMKPTRMLLLKLTDGTINCQAMEYSIVKQFNQNITPGTKIVLEGAIHYRLGTLLLTESHVTILGGAVEQLVEENSQICTLARELNREDLANNFHSNEEALTISQEEIILLPVNRIIPSMWIEHPIIYVKATIVRIDGEINSYEGVWSVGVTISDATGELQATIGNLPLEMLIGFTARDERLYKEESLRKCYQKLMTLHCVMELQCISNIPVITRLLDINDT